MKKHACYSHHLVYFSTPYHGKNTWVHGCKISALSNLISGYRKKMATCTGRHGEIICRREIWILSYVSSNEYKKFPKTLKFLKL